MQEIIEKACIALESEIEAVKKKPSKEILYNGIIKKEKSSSKEVQVEFDQVILSLKFVEFCKAFINEKEIQVRPIDFQEHSMILAFETEEKFDFDQVLLQWENDFILKKTLEKIQGISLKSEQTMLKALFAPEQFYKESDAEIEVYDDGSRNKAQLHSIEKALNQPVTFVWGPPGTGKTSTLGFIIANLLLHNKRVLFASNTNRAVDVGLLSIIDALQALDVEEKPLRLTRFGDIAIDNPELERYHFKKHIEQRLQEKKQKAIELKSVLDHLTMLDNQVEQLIDKNEKIPDALEMQLTFAQEKVQSLGGKEDIANRISMMDTIYERSELLKFQCITTTLAKVCTTELLEDVQFDAIVVDEASMANLPYLMVLATKCSSHMVLVGDPMQLPPIAVTQSQEQRNYLEKDIFTWLSGADSTNALFQWHDKWPGFTSFFDTQYRLHLDLANLVSTTFYEGRLKTAGKISPSSKKTSFQLLDTSPFNPFIEKRDGEGFKPMNGIHISKVVQLIHELRHQGVFEQEIGIIVPFRSVVWDYKKSLRNQGLNDVEVGTVHTFQGREKEVILFDTVMSGEGSTNQRHYTVRPFDEFKSGLQVPRLLNVAFSRSKNRFFVIADMNHINRVYRNRFLGRLLGKMKELQS